MPCIRLPSYQVWMPQLKYCPGYGYYSTSLTFFNFDTQLRLHSQSAKASKSDWDYGVVMNTRTCGVKTKLNVRVNLLLSFCLPVPTFTVLSHQSSMASETLKKANFNSPRTDRLLFSLSSSQVVYASAMSARNFPRSLSVCYFGKAILTARAT